jgi:hypothetical protein
MRPVIDGSSDSFVCKQGRNVSVSEDSLLLQAPPSQFFRSFFLF